MVYDINVLKTMSILSIILCMLFLFEHTSCGQNSSKRLLQDQQVTQEQESASKSEYNLNTFIETLDSLSVEEIIKSLEPIPTLEDCLAPLPDNPDAPWKRVLAGEDKKRVDELIQKSSDLWGQRRLSEAIKLSEEAYAIRRRVQGAEHWETIEFEWTLDIIKRKAELFAKSEGSLAVADRKMLEAEEKYKQGRYSDAVSLYLEMLELQRGILGDEHTEVATGLNQLGVILEATAQYQYAEPIFCNAIALKTRILGDEHPSTATSLNNLGVVLKSKGDYANAKQIICKVLEIRRKVLGDNNEDVATSLGDLAVVLHNQGESSKAEEFYLKTLNMQQGIYGNEHPQLAQTLNNLGYLFNEKGDHVQAEKYYRESLAIRRTMLGDIHPDVAVSLNNLAILLANKGDSMEAERLYREALTIYRKTLGDEHPNVATSLNNLALLVAERGDSLEAEKLMREALGIYFETLGENHPMVAGSMNRLAIMLRKNGDYAGAEPLYRKALALRLNTLGKNHPDTISSLATLAGFLCAKGDYAEAEPIYREVLSIRRRMYGEEHQLVATSLHNLAYCIKSKGDYERAYPIFCQTLDLQRKLLGDVHADVAACLNNLADLALSRGDYTEGESLLREVLEINRTLYGEEHLEVAGSLNNLAFMLSRKKDYVGAEQLFKESLDIHLKYVGDEHPDVATCLNNLAGLYDKMGKNDEAERLFRQALAMRRKFLDDKHSAVAESLYNVAGILYKKGHYAEAVSLYNESMAIKESNRTRLVGTERERALYADELMLYETAAYLANSLLQLNKFEEAFQVTERGRGRALLDLLARQDRNLVVERGRQYNTSQSSELDRLLEEESSSRAMVIHSENTLAATYKRKDITVEEKERIILEQSKAVNSARQDLLDAEAAVLAKLRDVWPDAEPDTVAEIRKILLPGEVILCYTWTFQSLALIAVPHLADGPVYGAILIDGVEKSEAFHELIHETWDRLVYRLRVAGDQDEDALLHKLYGYLMGEAPDKLRELILNARRLIVVASGPMTDIPFEALVTINPSSSKTRRFLEEGPEIVYAESATVYVNRRKEQRKRHKDTPSVLILGNPVFEWETKKNTYPNKGVRIAEVASGSNADVAGLKNGDVILKYDNREVSEFEALVERICEVERQVQDGVRSNDINVKVKYWRDGQIVDTLLPPGKMGVLLERPHISDELDNLDMRSAKDEVFVAGWSATDLIRMYGEELPPLPFTEIEAKTIAHTFEESGGSVLLLLGERATIVEMEKGVSGKQFLHVATHGLTGSRARPYDASLVLTQPKSPSPDDIGFLTLDYLIRNWQGKLRDCELVVLSACETQRGIRTSGSMMALPWGFMYAGAPTVVASLWKVDDTATMLLMTRFYENLLGQYDETRDGCTPGTRMAKASALREAKIWLRDMTWDGLKERLSELPDEVSRGITKKSTEEIKESRPYAHPFYWAAFILIGSPE